MRADLHIHTVYSDGAYTPAEIAARVKAAGVELCSMTDHDSLEGLGEKRAAAAARPRRVPQKIRPRGAVSLAFSPVSG